MKNTIITKNTFQFLLISLLSACGGSSNNEAFQNAANNEVVYISDKRSHQILELYSTNKFGKNTRRLSHDLSKVEDVIDFSISPDGKRVAYRATRSGDQIRELYIADIDGNNTYKASGNIPVSSSAIAGIRGEYAWSPDSKHLAYLSIHENGNVESTLYLASMNDTPYINITPDTTVNSIHWSPNSRYIVYNGSKNNILNSRGIYSFDIINQQEFNIVSDTTVEGGITASVHSWSPNSSYMIYLKQNVTPTNNLIVELYSALPDGTSNTNLSNGINTISSYWKWAPDGSRLAYISDQRTSGVTELYTIKPDATENIKMSLALGANEDVSGFSWSPDSSMIAYQAGDAANGQVDLYTVTLNNLLQTNVSGFSSSPERVTVYKFIWSPNSSRIAYLANQDDTPKLFLVNPDGTDIVPITDTDIQGNAIDNLTWSPNSEYIAFHVLVEVNFKAFIVSRNGLNITNFAPGSEFPDGSIFFDKMSWLSNNNQILYRGRPNASSTLVLVSYAIDTGINSIISDGFVNSSSVFDYDIRL